MRRHAISRAVAASLAMAPAGAMANGAGLLEPIRPALRPGNTTSLGLEASVGYFDAPDGVSFSWICHEILLPSTSSVTPLYFEGPGTSLLATLRSLGNGFDPDHSLYHSADGCDWAPALGLTNVIIREVAADPANPSHMLAASSTGTGASNGLYVSSNGGISWAQTSLFLPQRFFRSVRFAPQDPAVVYATASWFMPVGAWVYQSTNGGLSFTEHPWMFSDAGITQNNFTVEAVSPIDPNRALIRSDGSDDFVLYTSNGGVSFRPIFEYDLDIAGLAYDETGSAWLSVSASAGTYAAANGVDFTLVEGTRGLETRGMESDARGLFGAFSLYRDPFQLGVTTDGGATWQPKLNLLDVTGAKPCPADSDVTQICAKLFPALEARIEDALNPSTPPPSPSPTVNPGDGGGGGCSCEIASGKVARTAAYVAVFICLTVIVLSRRHRR